MLTALSEQEGCNIPHEKGWLHRYDLHSRVREGAEFVVHIPDDSIACNLNFSYKSDEPGNVMPLRRLDKQGLTGKGILLNIRKMAV